MRTWFVFLSLLITITPSFLFAAKRKVAVDVTPFVGYRQDNIKWNTSSATTNNKGSLKWKNLQGIEYGVKTETTIKDRYKIDFDLGFANFFKGTMTDVNYLAGPGSGNPTNNSLNGTGFAFRPNLAFGFNMKPLKSLDLIPQIGYLYDLLKLNGKKTTGNPLSSLSNTLQFNGPYLGIDSKMKFNQRWSMTAGGMVNLVFYNGKGNWKFQGNSTSNTMHQSGRGVGLKGQIGAQYMVVKSVALGAEGDIYWTRITNGNDSRQFANGVHSKTTLKSLTWTSFAGRLTLTKTF